MNTHYSAFLLLIGILLNFTSVAQIKRPIKPDFLPIRQLDTTLFVGATSGNANVSSGGAATYSVPIFVSPGTAGLQPNISIEYNSQVSNGVLGVGWNIAGLSAITRVPKDYYHDILVKGVNLQSDDRFDWDGNRLITTGVYGGNQTVYGTEAESFAKIISTNLGGSGTGPESFTVTTKEGMILTYGANSNSRIEAPGSTTVLLWRLDQMTDINGNYIKYYYIESSGDSYIDRIEYTGNSITTPLLLPYNVLKFTYENRADSSMYYIGGTKINRTKRLSGIDMISETKLVRHYAFSYLPVSTKALGYEKSRLAQIQETGTLNDVTKAINPTVINWGLNGIASFVTSVTNTLTNETTKSYFSDLNGDGRTDQFILGKTTGSAYYTRWYYYQSDGYTLTKISSGNLDISNCTGAFIADINNDGKNEILLNAQQNNAVREWHICAPGEIPFAMDPGTSATDMNTQNNATNLQLTEGSMVGIQPNMIVHDTCWSTFNYTYVSALNYSISNNTLVRGSTGNEIYSNGELKILPGQLNSDGKTDLLVLGQDNNILTGKQKGYILVSYPNFNTPDKVELIDFDGDGLSEVFVLKAGVYTIYKYNEANQAFASITSNTMAGATSTNLQTGDFNGDGKTDIVLRYANGYKFSVYLSTGSALTTPINTLKDNLDDSPYNVEADFSVLDLNGDGRDDILDLYTLLKDIPSGLNDTCANCFYADGGPSLVRYYANSAGKLSPYMYDKLDDLLKNKTFQMNIGDFDGDGMKDAALMINPTQWQVTTDFNGEIYMNFANLQKFRVETIVNGLNQAAGFTYISLASASANKYTKGKSSQFPLNDVQPAQFVVSSLFTHAGYMDAGTYVYSVSDFTYKGARSHLQGRGYLGFDTLVSVNNLSGVKTESSYGINGTYYFRYPLSTNTFVASAAVGTKTFTFVAQAAGTGKYYSYPSKNTNSNLLTNTTVTHDYTFDTFGNMLTDIAKYDNNAVITTTTNDYIAKGGTGIVNKLNSSTTSSVFLNKDPFSTKKSFTYDQYGNCVSTIDLTDPSKQITTTYSVSRSTCGLPVSVTVSAPGMTPRTSRTDYDSKYRMPVHSINPLGYTSKRSYNFALGVALIDTAANGLITKYNYDELGRLKSTVVPQGYTITQSLAWPKTADPAGTIYSATTVTPGKPTVKSYQDILGRAIRTESTGFANKTVYSDVSYLPATPYGKAGLATSQTLPYYTGETPIPVKYTYDAYGRVVAVDDRGMITQTNYSGKTFSTTDVAGRVSSKTVNAVGNIIKATDNGGDILYEYHSSGQPSKITAASAITNITYDIFGRQISLTDPDAGQTKYTYNAFGELASQTDANGNNDTLYYDILGRVTQKTLKSAAGSEITTYTYNTTGKALGQLASVTGANGAKQEFTYETLYGWPATVAQTIPGQIAKFTTSYTYDSYGNNTKITYPETGFAVTNTFDMGTLVKVNRFSDNSLIWQLNTLSSHGMPLQTTLGNGLTTTYGYDMDQLTQLTTGTVQNETYTINHPNIGNLAYRKDNITGQYENFTYDNLDRLTNILYKADTAQNKIVYSDNGNISSKDNGGAYTYSTPKVHAVTVVSKVHGNGTDQPLQDIAYTKFNKADLITQKTPVTQKTLTYKITYGPDQQRVKTVYVDTVATQTFSYYAGSYEKDSIKTTTSTTIKKIHYINGGAGLAAVYITWSTSGITRDTMYYVCTDRQGSITALFKQDRKVAERYSYDAWGRRRNPDNWTDFNVKAPRLITRGYTSHEMLDGFGLINMNGRMYDPIIGRVLSPDKVVQAPGYTQSYNRYSYCMNNPLRYSDPSGWVLEALDHSNDGMVYDRIPSEDWNHVYSQRYGGSIFGGFGGGGGYGLPGQGKNGTGLGGVYYDWSSSTYRRVENPSWEMDWYYVNKNIVQKYGVTCNYGAYCNSLQERNSVNDQKMAGAAVASWSEANRGNGFMGSIVEPSQEIQSPEVPIPLKVLYAVLFTDPVAWSVELTGATESGGAANATPLGGIIITAGPDAGTLIGFSSAGIGVGTLGASIMISAMKYYYSGNVNKLVKYSFAGNGGSASFSGGDGLDFGVTISWMRNRYEPREYIVSYGFGAGIGLPGASGQVSWTYTKIW